MTKISTMTRRVQPRVHIRLVHALLLLVAVLFVCMAGLVGGTARADASGEVTNLSLSSEAPGELTITWDAPTTTPEDYRVSWAKNDLSYLAWDVSNETHRGSAYPSGTAASHTLTGLTGGETYKVRMRSRYNTGTADGWSGPWSDELKVTISSTTAPATDEVTSLTLASDNAGQLAITWTDPSEHPTDYRISWAPADEDYLSYSEENTSRRGNSYPAGSATSLTLNDLPGGVNYKVIMRARYHDEQTNEDSSGPWTDEVTRRVRNNPPAAPTGLSASEVSDSSVTLGWTPPTSSGISGYRVLRGLTAAKQGIVANNTASTGTEYVDSDVEAGTEYHYSVRAINDGGVGPASNTIAVTTAGQALGPRQDTNTVPKFADADSDGTADPVVLSVVEQAIDVVAGTVSATDTDGDTLTYSISGTDATDFADAFSLNTATCKIRTTSSEKVDYETKPSYAITISVTDGENAAGVAETPATTDDTVSVTINVTNVDEAGTVTLSVEQPELAIPLRASLADLDGGESGVTWQWAHGATATGPFTDISGATNARYTPTSADVGKYLRATASYTDTQGIGQEGRRGCGQRGECGRSQTGQQFRPGEWSRFGGLDPVRRRGSSPEGIRRDTNCTMWRWTSILSTTWAPKLSR